MKSTKQEGFRVVIPVEKITLKRNQAELDKLERHLPAVISAFNQALAQLEALELGEFSLKEVSEAMSGVNKLENQVRERISENKPVKVGKLVFSAEKVKEMVEIPELSAANAALAELKSALELARKAPGEHIKHLIVLPNFEINGSAASFKEEAKQKFIDGQSIYAESDEQKEVALVLEEIKDRVDYLATKYGLAVMNKHHSGDVLFQWWQYDKLQHSLEINHDVVRDHFHEEERRKKYGA